MFEPTQLQEVAEGKKAYEAAVEKVLTKGPERKANFTTGGGIPLKRTYTPEDVNGVDYAKDLGFPGVYPYTRGVQPTMYRGRFWTMRQYAGFATAEDSNKRYRYLLSQGDDGTFCRVRPSDPDRLRLGRPDGGRRVRQGRRRDRQPCGR